MRVRGRPPPVPASARARRIHPHLLSYHHHLSRADLFLQPCHVLFTAQRLATAYSCGVKRRWSIVTLPHHPLASVCIYDEYEPCPRFVRIYSVQRRRNNTASSRSHSTSMMCSYAGNLIPIAGEFGLSRGALILVDPYKYCTSSCMCFLLPPASNF